LMDDVRATKRPLLITKRGKPVAKLVPVGEDDMDDFIGRLNGVFGSLATSNLPLSHLRLGSPHLDSYQTVRINGLDRILSLCVIKVSPWLRGVAPIKRSP